MGDVLLLLSRFARDPELRIAALEARFEFWNRRAAVLRARADAERRPRRRRRLERRARLAAARANGISRTLDRLKERCR